MDLVMVDIVDDLSILLTSSEDKLYKMNKKLYDTIDALKRRISDQEDVIKDNDTHDATTYNSRKGDKFLLPTDTYSIMMMPKVRSQEWAFGFFV